MSGLNKNVLEVSSTSPSLPSSLTPEQFARINRWCDQYEQFWRDNGNASLEDFLPQIQTEDRRETINELVLIDIELRRLKGFPVTSEYYLRACPTLDREWLEQQIELSTAQATQNSAKGLTIGQRIGDYLVVGPLGEGGMGSVYRAEHVLMKRAVALKIIQLQLHSSVLLKRRFEREVRTLATLTHPNVVTAFDARQELGCLYLVTEFLEGVDLGKYVREKGPLAPIQTVLLVLQAANGLNYAHNKGIIHRDIKPENLFLVGNQTLKVLDLGLARLTSSDQMMANSATLTEASQVLGTVSYISPEQARAPDNADARSDIYSLGCTLFFLLVGRPPYVAESMVATILAHVTDPVPSVANSTSGVTIPPQLDGLVQRMMAKDPDCRPSSMTNVIAELTEILSQLEGKAPLAPKMKAQTAVTRRRALYSAIAILPLFTFAYWVSHLLAPADVKLGPILNSPNGLVFNGIDTYVEVDNFDEPITGHVAIEALVRPNFSNSTSSIVSWTGEKSFVIFRSVGNEWGVAYFDGFTARLIVASHSSRPGTAELVGAVWDGNQLSLHVDGKQIEAYPIEYEMIPAPKKLFIGGIPDGIIPSHQGTRYLNGEVTIVRVSRSDKPIRLATDPSLLAVGPETLAIFDFRKPTHLNTIDLTQRWPAQLRGTFSRSQ